MNNETQRETKHKHTGTKGSTAETKGEWRCRRLIKKSSEQFSLPMQTENGPVTLFDSCSGADALISLCKRSKKEQCVHFLWDSLPFMVGATV